MKAINRVSLSVKCTVKILVTFPAKRNPMIPRQINIVHELIIAPSLELYVCKLIYISNLIITVFRVCIRYFSNDFLLQRSQCLDLVLIILHSRSKNHQFASACYYPFFIPGPSPSVYCFFACAYAYFFIFKQDFLHFAVTAFGNFVLIRASASHSCECLIINSKVLSFNDSVECPSNGLSLVCRKQSRRKTS